MIVTDGPNRHDEDRHLVNVVTMDPLRPAITANGRRSLAVRRPIENVTPSPYCPSPSDEAVGPTARLSERGLSRSSGDLDRRRGARRDLLRGAPLGTVATSRRGFARRRSTIHNGTRRQRGLMGT